MPHTDSSPGMSGLSIAVATMRKMERCHLIVSPAYGYGEANEQSLRLLCDLHDLDCSDTLAGNAPDSLLSFSDSRALSQVTRQSQVLYWVVMNNVSC